jgi:hypothetical protein
MRVIRFFALPLVFTPMLVAQESPVPLGTRFIGDVSTKQFLSVDCTSVDAIPQASRIYFRTRASAQAGGYREIDCTETLAAEAVAPAPVAAAPVPTPSDAPPPASARITPPPTAVPTQAAADSDLPRRRGFWFNGGLGYGSATCDEDFICAGSEGSVSGTLSLGGGLSQTVLLGVMTNGWVKDDALIDLTIGTLLGVIRFYPSDGTQFFLQGGLGVGRVDVTVSGIGSADESGFAGLVGIGYDIRLGDNLSLTPYLNGFATGTESATWSVGQLGLSLTVH